VVQARRWCRVALVLLASAGAALADEPTPTEQKVAPSAFNTVEPQPEKPWGTGDGQSFWVPVADIFLFDFLLNQYNRHYVEPLEDYRSNWDSIEHNAGASWVYDSDSFDINQFGHPYQGSMYFGFARSAGNGFWTALGYTVAGSAAWEVAGETTPPSFNDQLTTGFGGALLGEPLFRMASLVLEAGRPSRLRTFGASLVSPATGLNRWGWGGRFDGVFKSRDPAVHTRATLGANVHAAIRSDVNANPDPNTPPIPLSYEEGEPVLDFTMVYGLPGKPGYKYERPFDYFHFQLRATPDSVIEDLMTRGLLVGRAVGDGAHYRGVWGLYGSYDYIAPQIFRVSNTAVNVGTTGQWWVSRNVALQNELIVGAGYGSGGTARRSGLRDYHYGFTPQALGSLRLLVGDLAALEVSGRDYYITDRGSDALAGTENLVRVDAQLTIRVWDLHGLTLRYVMSERKAQYDALDDAHQAVTAISIGYTYIGHKWFGAVDWRPRPEQRTEELIDRPLEDEE
jgi:Domain of unknown function (DUF3943)